MEVEVETQIGVVRIETELLLRLNARPLIIIINHWATQLLGLNRNNNNSNINERMVHGL